MTNQEYFGLFSVSMNKKKIIRYENENSRDDYHVYAYRYTPDGFIFFCRIETFFRTAPNENSWKTGSLSSFHELSFVQGATSDTFYLTNETFRPAEFIQYPLISGPEESAWITADPLP